MQIFIIIALSVICISLILIWFICVYNRFQNLIIRINEAEVNIDAVLRKRFDLLNKSIDIIKANTNTKNEVLNIIVKLRSRKLDNFDLDRKLYEAIKEFNSYIEYYPDLKLNEAFMKIDIAISESEAEIEAFRRYYNDIITDYNKIVRTFPTNIAAIIFKQKKKPYFDGKDPETSDSVKL
jgi:LemA protein